MKSLDYAMRPIRPCEIDMVADMISAGYYDDEFFIWSVCDDDKRHKVVADYYKIYIGAAGCVAYVAETPGGEIVGAAVWLPHDTDASVYDEIDRVTGVYSPQFRAVSDRSHDSEPPMGPFYQLVGFVVPRQLQGMGIGAALLKHQLDKLDETGIPTYLEASTPYFGGGVYGKFGYQPVGELMVFADTAVLYPLWRPAAKAGEPQTVIRDEKGLHSAHHCEERSDKANNRIVRFGEYDWRVLEESNGKTLLLSEQIIYLRQYHDTFEDVTWANSSIREYLNVAFYNSFTPKEQSLITKAQIKNRRNPWYGIDGGMDTSDKIFLLSVEEVVKYFGGNGQPGGRDNFYIDDEFNNARQAVCIKGSPTRWMLRTPGKLPYMVVTATINGRIAVTGDFVNRQSTELFNVGIRPAMWVTLA